jgi:hypothetical protein
VEEVYLLEVVVVVVDHHLLTEVFGWCRHLLQVTLRLV